MAQAAELAQRIADHPPGEEPLRGQLDLAAGQFASFDVIVYKNAPTAADGIKTDYKEWLIADLLKKKIPGTNANVAIGPANFDKMAKAIEESRGEENLPILGRMRRMAQRLSRSVIADVGTVDHLIAAEEFNFPSDLPAVVMNALGLINPEKVTTYEFGAEASKTPLGELRVAGVIYPDEKQVKRVGLDKVVTMPDPNSPPKTERLSDSGRSILANVSMTGVDYDREKAGEDIIFGCIEGGDGKADVLFKIQEAMAEIEVYDFAMAISARGSDLRVTGAVLRDMPETEILTRSDLKTHQIVREFTDGRVDAVGTVFSHRRDERFQNMQRNSGEAPTGYKSHYHSDTAGHVAKIVPGKGTRTYFVICPVKTAVDIQPIPSK